MVSPTPPSPYGDGDEKDPGIALSGWADTASSQSLQERPGKG